MRLFFVECAFGNDKFVFARSTDQAAEMFVAWQILNGVEMGDFAVERVTAASRVEPDATHLRQALRLELEGIGHYDDDAGWTIEPVRDERDQEA